MKKILITGGQMQNKGAQAMTFKAVCEMKRIYPDYEIVLLPAVYNKSETQFDFSIVPFPSNFRLPLLSAVYRILRRLLKSKQSVSAKKPLELRLKQCFENAVCLLDISGFALSSQMGFSKSCMYLYTIALAKKYKIPMYILPQSFGPFNYPKAYQRIFIHMLMKKYMKYPRLVFAREQAGLVRMKLFRKNILLSTDIVLQGNTLDTNLIFKPDMRTAEFIPSIASPSVGIVPNQKTWEHGDPKQIKSVLNMSIQRLLDKGYGIYLLAHSKEDVLLCEQLKDFYSENNAVKVISQEFNCISLQKILKQFDFIIASRYHSIVHAYKETVPVIALGWAEKYAELLQVFGQSKYLFDVREELDLTKITKTIDDMISSLEVNRSDIQNQLIELKRNNIFNRIVLSKAE